MANLFGKNKLKSVAQAIDTDDVLAFIDIVKKWHHDYHHGTLKQDKETSREQEYNQNFFKDILGYKEKPATPFNFEPKATTLSGQLPDAVVGYTDKTNNIENLAAVVELKGASIPLDRPQRREGNMSPVQQGFKYKTQYRNCPFVIVSNFYEFRLYRDNQLDYELWTLDDLVDPTDDYFLFKTWYVLLKGENFITSKGASKTELLLSDIRIQQEDIGKKFYKVYKEARIGLLRDVYANNKHVRGDIDFGIEKAQKIIDRIVFTAFAEDRGLLPDNTLQRVVREAEQSSFGIGLWQAFKGLFEAIDSGSDKLEIPGGYNGGLFKTDLELNSLKISDDALRPVIKLGNYNFSEDLSVNILGHIFEQSISDLEEIKTKVSESQNIEVLNQNRRKKDGIFYTPDYIVRYIVENSLGIYLRETEERLKTEFKLHGDINDKTYVKREQSAYGKYQDFLQNIKVVDPACGSGAFLVYVFDYLLAENKRVASILGNNLFSSDDYVKSILQNNIYGVDLNDESVEITKLSLWLKTAQKGKKLATLDQNIKCGNSLTDNRAVAGNKAFDWQKQFANVFSGGGFDVVVGNPPYVKEYTSKISFDGLRNDPIYQGKMDLWYFFGSLALNILKPQEGIVGFIAPSNWVTNSGAQKFRNKVLSDGKLIEFIDFGDFKVFDQAGIQTMIYIMRRSSNNLHYQFSFSKVVDSKINHEIAKSFLAKVDDQKFIYFDANIDRPSNIDNTLNFNNKTVEKLLDKIKRSSTTYLDDKEVAQGIVAPQDYVNKSSQAVLGDEFTVGDGVFNLSMQECRSLNLSDSENSIIKPFYTTNQLHRHYGDPQNQAWVIYTDSKFKDPQAISHYPNIKRHLDRFYKVITSDNKPYGLHRARDEKFFTGEKIISLRKASRPTFTFTDFDTYVSQTYFVIKTNRMDMRYLTAILNSKLIAFWLKHKGKMQGDMYQIDKAPLLDIPIVVSDNQDYLVKLAMNMSANLSKLHAVENRAQLLFASEFGILEWPAKLKEWWKLDFSDFLNAFKIQLSLQQKDELLSVFEKYCLKCTELSTQIECVEQDINQIVYKLYGLNNDDVNIVENL